jgi:hypothetical protein
MAEGMAKYKIDLKIPNGLITGFIEVSIIVVFFEEQFFCCSCFAVIYNNCFFNWIFIEFICEEKLFK